MCDDGKHPPTIDRGGSRQNGIPGEHKDLAILEISNVVPVQADRHMQLELTLGVRMVEDRILGRAIELRLPETFESRSPVRTDDPRLPNLAALLMQLPEDLVREEAPVLGDHRRRMPRGPQMAAGVSVSPVEQATAHLHPGSVHPDACAACSRSLRAHT